MLNTLNHSIWTEVDNQIAKDANWILNQCPYKFYHDKQDMMIPCGKCVMCKRKDKNRLVSRLTLESKVAVSSWFVTLTYNAENLPIKNGVPSLNQHDVTKFIKRIRNYLNGKGLAGAYKIDKEQKQIHDNLKAQGKPFRYFLVGEYGDVYQRPHYHLILFNLHHSMKIPITRLWGKGKIDWELPRNPQSTIQYSASYMIKPSNYTYGADKPFRLMSKNLGLDFLKKFPGIMKEGLIKMPDVQFRPPDTWQNYMYSEKQLLEIREKTKEKQIETYNAQYDALAKLGVEPTHMMEGMRRLKEARVKRQIERGKSSKM